MQTIINPTHLVDSVTKERIMHSAPSTRQGIKQDLTNTLTQDAWVQFAQQNTSAYKIDDAGNIVSYCAFGNKGNYYHNFIPNILHNFYRPALLIYLFTREDEQNKGYAKKLFWEVLSAAQSQGHDGILLSTWSPQLQEMYQRWWCSPCKVIHPTNSFFVKEGITKDAVLGVQLVGK
jgi:GNAT superfamily N-acetyltransferase